MSRGSYYGGSTVLHVGPGFIGSGSSNLSPRATGKKKKIKRLHPGFSGHMTLEEARHAGLSHKQWQSQSSKHVAKVERQLVELKLQLEILKKELKLAEKARQRAFAVTGPSPGSPKA